VRYAGVGAGVFFGLEERRGLRVNKAACIFCDGCGECYGDTYAYGRAS